MSTPHEIPKTFIQAFLRKEEPAWEGPEAGASCPIGTFWASVNLVRTIGPAPVIDAIKAIQAVKEDAEFFDVPSASMREALLDALDMMLLPLLDGIVVQDADFLANKAIEIFGLDSDQSTRIKARLASVAV